MPDIVVIDEPELGLHPQALIIIANLIEEFHCKNNLLLLPIKCICRLFHVGDIVVVNKNADDQSI